MPDTDKQLHTGHKDRFLVVQPNENWVNDGDGRRVYRLEFHQSVSSFDERQAINIDLALRYNALAGLNPDGVAELVAAAELVLNNQQENYPLMKLEKALANVKDGQ